MVHYYYIGPNLGLPNCPFPYLDAKLSVWLLGAKLSFFTIFVPNCLVTNCPGAKLSGPKLSGAKYPTTTRSPIELSWTARNNNKIFNRNSSRKNLDVLAVECFLINCNWSFTLIALNSHLLGS